MNKAFIFRCVENRGKEVIGFLTKDCLIKRPLTFLEKIINIFIKIDNTTKKSLIFVDEKYQDDKDGLNYEVLFSFEDYIILNCLDGLANANKYSFFKHIE